MPGNSRTFPMLVSALALLVWGPVPRAHGHDPASIERGVAVADRVCVGCHVRDGESQKTIEGVLVPSFRTIAQSRSRTPEQLQDFILTPHRPMPAIPLEIADVKDVVAYIVSLRD